MAYHFDKTANAWMKFALGPFSGHAWGAWTFAVFVKRSSGGLNNTNLLNYFTTAALADRFDFVFNGSNGLSFFGGSQNAASSGTWGSSTPWYLLAATRAAGSNACRFHAHDGTSWTHANNASGQVFDTTVSATDIFWFGVNATSTFGGDLAVTGIKNSDSTDLQIETLSRTSLAGWVGFGFDWLASFDAITTRTNLANPGSGDETSRGSGITLVTDPPGWSAALGPPVADFTGTPTSGSASLSVAFTDASTNTPTSWAWDFGDGGTSTSQNPTHSYSTSGTFTVQLTATNTGGSDTKTRTGYITVSEAIVYAAGAGLDIW